MEIQSIKSSKFYNRDLEKFEIISSENRKKSPFKPAKDRFRQRIMGPTEFWKQFPRQAEALEAAEIQSEKETVCTFVYQKENGYREFIVAHPEVYWWYFMQMPSESRCSYEVIPEDSPCWLYFDLEFSKKLNPDNDGARMTRTLINIFVSYIEKYWGIRWEERNIVNLDSTTSKKFSRHLIFCKSDVAFKNNRHVGGLVKGVCVEIENYLEDGTALHGVLSRYERRELEELFVETNKGKKIFVDTGVYTRNRHFRTYKSTKQGKLSHFEIALESKHVPLRELSDKFLAVFLDSLISYFPDKKNLQLLEIKHPDAKGYVVESPNKIHCASYRRECRGDVVAPTLYPKLDKFVLSLVKPGKIRTWKRFDDRKIIYEIIGYRYCGNIGRQHKSNNIFWVADLKMKKVYQRCHDEDCANFTSAPISIPLEIVFHFDSEDDRLFEDVSVNENEAE